MNLIDEKKNIIVKITEQLLDKIGFSAKVALINNEDTTKVFFVVAIDSSDDSRLLIGKNGQNLASLEHLVRILANRTIKSGINDVNFILDIDDYRKSRSSHIARLAHDTAQRVVQTRRAEALMPMSAYERRLVHMELASYSDLQTESIGEEPNRRIVIKPDFF